MPVYRGPGGAGDATNDATISAVQTYATQAATSATQAATSATDAATSATGASTSATNAANSATTAAGSVTTAAGHVSSASTFATNSSLSADDSAASALEAEGYASEAFDYKVAASLSAEEAALSATSATASQLAAESAALAVDGVLTDPDFITVLGLSDELQTVAGNTTNINIVAANNTNITAVAGNATDITTVAAAVTPITTVAGNDANVRTVATNISNVNTVAGNTTNVNTVAGISANVTTVATNNANVTTVATNIASVNTNATNIANINQNAANIVAIQGASTNATNAAASALAASGSATSASASAAAASAVALGNEPVRHSVRPSLLLDFANAKQLDPRITFSRPTTAKYYDGKTTVKAEENLLLQSQAFATSWTLNSTTLIANSVVAPDGTTTAYTLTNDTATSAHGVYQANTTTTGYTYSIYAKTGTTNYLGITNTSHSTLYSGATFDLTAGTVAASQNCTASITSVGNGWYRCIVANNTTYAGSYFVASILESVINPWTVYTGTTKNIYIWGAQLEQRSTVTAYTPTTTAPITNYIPVLLTQQSNESRFDHNPTTGESLGLLIEEQRTNLLTYSDDFSNAAWTKSNTTVFANTIVAPDGTLTGDKLQNTAVSTAPHIKSPTISVSATAYTSTVYAKNGGCQWLRFASTYSNVWFDLTNGVVGASAGGTGVSASITPVGNGWFKCVKTETFSAGSVDIYLCPQTANSQTTYTGDGYSGIYIWGAQLEAGAFATSYIPTVASQVTRSADSASMTGTNFSSWYRADAWTMYSEAMDRNGAISGTNFTIYSISDTTANNEALSRFIGTSTGTQSYGSNGGAANQWALYGTSTSVGAYKKLAIAYGINDVAFCDSGATVSTDSSALLISNMTQLLIGGERSNTQYLNGTIKKLAYYPKRLTNSELQGLTTV